jgi:hypothetical protein
MVLSCRASKQAEGTWGVCAQHLHVLYSPRGLMLDFWMSENRFCKTARAGVWEGGWWVLMVGERGR